jgi:hypothetical protein
MKAMTNQIPETTGFIGQWVEWTSGAHGVSKAKKGKVVAIIPVGQSPASVAPNIKTSSTQDKTGNGWTGKSINERVLVEVPRVGGKGQALKPWYYAPRISAVNPCEES